MGLDDYKRRNKPHLNEEKTKYKQGYFVPKHPEKCVTKTNIFRSSWEAKLMDWFDRNDTILRWGSEPIAIKYMDPVGNMKYCKKNNLDPTNPRNWKPSNYYTDFWCEMRQADGGVKKIFVEVKPYAQTIPPKPLDPNANLRQHKAFNKAAETYLTNTAKWKAALKFCKERGCDFMIVTEKTLTKLGLL